MEEKKTKKRPAFDAKDVMKNILGEDTTMPFDDRRGAHDERYWRERRPDLYYDDRI